MPMTNEEYVAAEGFKCPDCGSASVSAGSTEFGLAEAYTRVDCRTCGARWTELYKLTGYTNLSTEE